MGETSRKINTWHGSLNRDSISESAAEHHALDRRQHENLGEFIRSSTGVSMPEVPSGEVTVLLQNWAKGDARALDDLIPLVHQELQAFAHRQLRSERADHTLQSTALVSK
jgi:hypothetical protein